MAELKLQADSGGGASSLKGPASSGATPSWRLPSADGSSGQYLKTDGSGVMSWGTVAAGTGRILQVQQYTSNGRNINSTNSYAGVGLSDTITPTAASSKILVLVSGMFGIDSANAAVVRVQAGWQVTWNHSGISESVLRKTQYSMIFPEDSGMDMILHGNVNFSFIHHPNTTNEITYDVQCKCTESSASIEFISGGSNEWYKTITLVEIGAPDTTNLVGEP